MEACHSFWSEPNRCRNQGEIRFPDFEQLTAILSALEWKRHSGPVRMLTDTAGAAYFREIGLSAFWDGTESVLADLAQRTDPYAFWAAGKLWALGSMPVPCVMLDTDLIVWENVISRVTEDAVAAHPEPLNPRTYPDPSVFRLTEGYAFPEKWDFSLNAANTAFLFFRDRTLRDTYLEEAMDFMQHVRTDGSDPVQTMCFAEQRILPMCAKAEGVALETLLREDALDNQSIITHLWGHKRALEADPVRRVEYCLRCAARILSDFPDWADVLAANAETNRYTTELR